MRLAVAVSSRQVVGGIETWLRALVPELLRRNHAVVLVTEFAAAPGQPAIGDGAPGVPTLCRQELGADRVLAELARWEPDIVFAHGLAIPAFEAALLDRFPVALYAHTYVGTCAVGTKRHAFPRYQPCTRRMGPSCLVVNYLRRCGGLSPIALHHSYARQRRLGSFLPRYAAIFVASRHMREEFLRHGIAGDALHLAPLAPPGLEPDPEPPAERPPTGRIAFLGRLTRLKGVHLLLDAVERASRELGRVRLDVMGNGPEQRRLEETARRRGLDVHFSGWVEGGARIEQLRAADLLAVPSLWPEPFGLVGVEAGCVGVPAVAFAQGGIPDWLRPGISGELAPSPPTAAGLAGAIVRALADPSHHARLRRGAWETSRTFTMAAHLAVLEPILAQAVQRAATRSSSAATRSPSTS